MEKHILPEPIIFNKKWISEGIGEAYKNWHTKADAPDLTSPSRVLIESATGTGKTNFIIKQLLPYAAQKNRHILYICNRIALEEQLVEKLKEITMDITGECFGAADTAPKTFQYPNSDATITILNYQSIPKGLQKILPLYYVIMDEAHFFLSDALFNQRTNMIWENLLMAFPQEVLIFMTATSQEFKKLFEYYIPYLGAGHPHPLEYTHFYKNNIEIYHNTYHPSTYNFLCYQKNEEIVTKINRSCKDEKWLIFVNAKKDGKALCEEIKSVTKRKAKFLSADNKQNKTWENIIEKNCFTEDILITTKVLDNGINIKDEKVKHIVLPFCDETDFIQMLGRRRILDESKKINVYVEQPSIQQINSLLYYLKYDLKAADKLHNAERNKDSNPSYYKSTNNELIRSTWNRPTDKTKRIFYMGKNNILHLNTLAYFKIKSLQKFYLYLRSNYKKPYTYLNEIIKWVGMPPHTPVCHIYYERCYSFSDFINHFLNIYIKADEIENFYCGFEYYFKGECYNTLKDDTAKYEEALKIKKDPNRRKTTMNESLEILNLPYEIKKRKNCWVLKEK